MKASVRIDVKKPIQEVWDFISDIENIDHWLEGFSETKRTSDSEFAIGSTFASKYVYNSKLYQVAHVVTLIDAPYRLAFRLTAGPHPADTILDLKTVKDSTRVTQTLDLGVSRGSVGVVFLGLGPIARFSIMLKLRKELKSLKARVEAG